MPDKADINSSYYSLPATPPPPPQPIDRDALLRRKKIDEYEALLVKKLVARTPKGPEGEGALRVLTHAFTYYDQDGGGLVNLAEFTRVLAKLGCVSALPPSDIVRPLVEGLFAKHAKAGQVHYREFAVAVLRNAGIRVPAADGAAREAEAQARDWHYSTAVRQALARRNLDHSVPAVPATYTPAPYTPAGPYAAHQMHPEVREAWAEPSTAARAKQEGAAYRIPPRRDVVESFDLAAMRGRLPGGSKGVRAYEGLKAEHERQTRQARASYGRSAREAFEREHAEYVNRDASTLNNWRLKLNEIEKLKGLTPGEYAATQRRRAMR